jgi:hypothetical protein
MGNLSGRDVSLGGFHHVHVDRFIAMPHGDKEKQTTGYRTLELRPQANVKEQVLWSAGGLSRYQRC